jgi:hypothetical protein
MHQNVTALSTLVVQATAGAVLEMTIFQNVTEQNQLRPDFAAAIRRVGVTEANIRDSLKNLAAVLGEGEVNGQCC